MKTAFLIFIFVHGAIHLPGFTRAFQLADVRQLRQPISKPAGILWFTAAVLFLISLCFLLLNNQSWWIVGGIAVLSSQSLVIHSWADAKFGSMANAIILLPVIVSFIDCDLRRHSTP